MVTSSLTKFNGEELFTKETEMTQLEILKEGLKHWQFMFDNNSTNKSDYEPALKWKSMCIFCKKQTNTVLGVLWEMDGALVKMIKLSTVKIKVQLFTYLNKIQLKA